VRFSVEFDPSEIPVPRPVVYFEDQALEVGVRVASAYGDAVVHAVVHFDLSEAVAQWLFDHVTDPWDRLVCRLRGHDVNVSEEIGPWCCRCSGIESLGWRRRWETAA
jgi:hypothetical protein